ncbi:hypothetical protein FOA43_003067 [Brettanomyces nanus]|uniref:GYF domain-containing protein n=1 Tax=Eeniella nana TaxID=13502 RepID=A0A875S427_EENNA|nr:uncharacterized protein FOA43_003067 [Brettanomyces nanus]QPG75708.1 hypothetical protein FOA43_003067 [Brettanomyces nanus]
MSTYQSQPQSTKTWFNSNSDDILSNSQLPVNSEQQPMGVDQSANAQALSISMQSLFAIYSSMAENHQLIPGHSDANFKSNGITRPLHVDVLIQQQQERQKKLQNADALASKLAGIALRDSDGSRSSGSPASQLSSLSLMPGGSVQQRQQLDNSSSVTEPTSASNGMPAPGLQRQISDASQQRPMTPHMLDPSQIRWYYLDPRGIQQGPFDGNTMQQWYTQKYLALDLCIRREGHSNYKTLGDFVSFIGEYQYPFSVPLPVVHVPVNSGPVVQIETPGTPVNSAATPSAAVEIAGTSSGPVRSSFQAFESTSGFLASSDPSAPSAPSALSALSAPSSSSAWSVGNADFFKNDMYANPSFLHSDAALNVSGKLFGNDDKKLKQLEPEVLLQSQPEPRSEPLSELHSESQVEFSKPKSKKHKLEKIRAEPKSDFLEESEIKTPSKHHIQPHVVKTSESSKPSKKGSKTVIAPWASSTAQSTAPPRSLTDIQREEEEEKKKLEVKARSLLEEQDRLLASKLALEEERGDSISDDLSSYVMQQPDNDSASLPTTSTWGSSSGNNVVKQPVKSLEEIQREETRMAVAKERALAASHHQKSIASAIAAQKQTFASSVSSGSSRSNDSSWTVVTSKKVKSVATNGSALSALHRQHTATSLSPATLRSVSSNAHAAAYGSSNAKVIKAVATTAPSSSGDYFAAKQFLAWCRVQLQGLYTTVNREDVLSIMLQLPAGSESTEIISDTIYSNSSVMDGRRFAGEFNKRRCKVEEYVVKQGYDFNWQELLQNRTTTSTASASHDDSWDTAFTKVVSKRSRRRN